MPSATRSRWRAASPAAAPVRTAPRPACRPRPRRADRPADDRARFKQLGVDDRGGVRQGGAQLVVIGDDHVHALAAGVTGCLVRGHAGVAGEDQPRALRDHLLQVRQVNAVRGGLAHRHVVADMRTQVAQGSDQQRGGGLAVHVEIAPHADRLAAADGAPQPVDRPRHARQRVRRGRDVRVRVEESDRRGRGHHPAAREGLRHERVPADRGGEGGGDGDVRGSEPVGAAFMD